MWILDFGISFIVASLIAAFLFMFFGNGYIALVLGATFGRIIYCSRTDPEYD